jgi:hypothetical protein
MNNRLYVATRKGLFTIDRTGDRKPSPWKVTKAAFLGDNVSIVMFDKRDQSVYAALDHGHFGVKLHLSRDAEETWQELAAPTYPEKPADAEDDHNPMSNKPVPWNTELIWSLEAGGADQSGVLWCGTVPGGLFHSGDHGASWNFIRSLWDRPERRAWFGGGLDFPGIHSICVDPRDSNTVRIGVSCGGVWTTRDGGETWNCTADGMWAAYMPPESKNDPNIQDPHCMVQCPGNPDALWVQHHNGVFKSTDGATSWHEAPAARPSTFGFAVAVHPRDPQTAWFVPAIKDEKRIPVDGKVVVSRTRDGGKSFDVLTKGLPQGFAYDLTFRHALVVDESGDRLAFGSTTGSLWVSEDQGDSWTCVTANLPPVYCIRYA